VQTKGVAQQPIPSVRLQYQQLFLFAQRSVTAKNNLDSLIFGFAGAMPDQPPAGEQGGTPKADEADAAEPAAERLVLPAEAIHSQAAVCTMVDGCKRCLRWFVGCQ
jgi:hypothetical protein